MPEDKNGRAMPIQLYFLTMPYIMAMVNNSQQVHNPPRNPAQTVATLAESRKKDPVIGVRSLDKHTYIA